MGSPAGSFATISNFLVELDGLELMQRITGLSVVAGPESVRIRFHTVLSTTAMLTVHPYATGNVFTDAQTTVASSIEWFGGPRYQHDFRIDDLKPDTHFWFRV